MCVLYNWQSEAIIGTRTIADVERVGTCFIGWIVVV